MTKRQPHFRLSRLILPLMLVPTLVACAPGLGARVPFTPNLAFDFLEEENTGRGGYEDNDMKASLALCDARVAVFSVEDLRPSRTLVTVDGRQVQSEQPLEQDSKLALERLLVENGYTLEKDAPLQVNATLKILEGDVTPGFPTSSVTSQASVEVSLMDDHLKRHFAANFRGTAKTEDPFLSESDIDRTVSLSLIQALGEAARSRALCFAAKRTVVADQEFPRSSGSDSGKHPEELVPEAGDQPESQLPSHSSTTRYY